MKLDDREESTNVEDQRGNGKTIGMMAGGGGILIIIVALLLGVDPRQLINPGGGPGPANKDGRDGEERPERKADPEEEKQAHFTKVVFHDTEVIWDEQFRKMDKKYKKPTLVLFTDQVKSACGFADAAVGPFYCPGDGKVYIDLSFYQDMQKKLNAPGDFARAYVVAHEVGHHVQKLLGYSARVDDARERGSKTEHNRMSVRLELQADYLAGVWAHYAQEKFKFLEKGDLESALNAAFEIGDDRLQKKARGRVVPDSFTHGTSKQRMRWFKQGFQTGDIGKASLLFDLHYDEL